MDTKYNISLYAKKTGKATQENKYDYPPPVDKELYFGSNALVSLDGDGVPQDLTKKMWDKIYEHLFGGFEDLNDTEDESDDENDVYNELEKTKSGYAKDGFIVDDDDLSDDASDDSDEVVPTPKRKAPKKVTKKSDKDVILDNMFMEFSNELDELLDSTKELEKEDYM